MIKTASVWVGLIVVALIAIGGYMYPQAENLFGSFGTRFPSGLAVGSGASVTTTGAMVVGSAGSQKTLEIFGTCTPTFSSSTLAASSTAVGICTDSSFTTASQVFAAQKLTTVLGLTGNAFPVKGIVATTSGQFGVMVTNEIGAATTSINSVFRTYSYKLVR